MMKKTLTEIFDETSAKELDIVLGKSLDVAADVPDSVSLERIKANVFAKTQLSEVATNKKKNIKITWKAIAMAAAGFALIISAGLGSYAYASELKEYKAAVSFFNDYGLSTDGLSRGEIKEVYHDIKTEAFSYSKTAEVIAKSISDSQVDGFEIIQNVMTPEDVEDLWNYKNYNGNYMKAGAYKYYSEYKLDEERGFEVHDKSWFEKYDEDDLLWQISFEEFSIDGYAEVSNGVIIYGNTPIWPNSQRKCAWIAKVDNVGNILWKQKLENDFENEYIAGVIENNDGTYAVFSREDLKYFCLSQYDAEGNVKSFKKTEVGNYGIWNVARFGDGYIVQLGNYTLTDSTKIVKVDSEGNITESFSYKGEDCFYYITDMIEYNGKIYLSAYAVPKNAAEDENAGNRYEIEAILNYIFENDNWEISSEELTPMVRDNYTAMLLICEPDEGIPQEFYSVKGSLGGKLALDSEGRLLWDVESITTTFFSPATSSFTIGGTNYVFRYTFDNNGTLISQEKTGETTIYRK